jgi:hypothetical protein
MALLTKAQAITKLNALKLTHENEIKRINTEKIIMRASERAFSLVHHTSAVDALEQAVNSLLAKES